MPQSLSSLVVHIVFSTKNREMVLDESVRSELERYTAGVVRNKGGLLLAISVMLDHVHLLLELPRTESASAILRDIKTGTSRWLRGQSPLFESFRWQRGYAIFSVSRSARKKVERYIVNQAEHHKRLTFMDEYVRMLRGHHLDFDERYLWD